MLMCRDCAIYNTWLCRYKDNIKAESSARNCPDFLMDAKKAFDRGKNEGQIEAFNEVLNYADGKSDEAKEFAQKRLDDLNNSEDIKSWIGEWG